MQSYNKLVRDKIPARLDRIGVPYEKRIAGAEEYKIELVKKLLEEATEFSKAAEPEELADVMEVIVALRQLPEYAKVEELRIAKREEKGGFEERIILKDKK